MDYRDSPTGAVPRTLRLARRQRQDFPTSETNATGAAGRMASRRFTVQAFGLSCRRSSVGTTCRPPYDVILDEELAKAGAPPRPSLGYLLHGLCRHGSVELQERFLPGMIDGTERWCQGFSEPGAGSDLASLRTAAVREGDSTSSTGTRSGPATPTSPTGVCCWPAPIGCATAPGISAFIVPMDTPVSCNGR